MEIAKQNTLGLKQGLIIGLSLLVAVLLLFSIDRETHSISDLGKPENIGAFVLYFVPSFAICLYLYSMFARKRSKSDSVFLSLLIGIPLSFAVVITTLMFVMKRWP